jgi:hypothetical protein
MYKVSINKSLYVDEYSTIKLLDSAVNEIITIPREKVVHGDYIVEICGHKAHEHQEKCDKCDIVISNIRQINLEMSEYCCICMDNKSNVFYSCGHTCVCNVCHKELCKDSTLKCPCCRKNKVSATILNI